ncbi:MAG: PHB depolymerase family esterase [Alphaproteobacteria bacterium]|nr:PHB depolymerase family esterase [Alphaproteobacteria bacterium]
MKSLFGSWLKSSRTARKRTLKTAAALQRIVSPPAPKKAKKSVAKAKPKKLTPKKALTPPPEKRPPPGSFVDGHFACREGKLAYKLYTPQGSTRRRLPLVVMLHGCAQTAANFAVGTRMNTIADERGFLVLYPQQSTSANLNRCWNWHRPGDQTRGSGEPSVIAALTHHIVALCKANSSRVYIAGISAGGAAAAITAAAYPELFIAVGVHSGLERGDIRTLHGALSAMRGGAVSSAIGKTPAPVNTIVFHGDQDKIVHPSNAAGFLSVLRRSSAQPLKSRSETGRSKGGRDFTRTQYWRSAGKVLLENWTVHGSGHAWSGGSVTGAYTDPAGPDASREMIRFFLAHKRAT